MKLLLKYLNRCNLILLSTVFWVLVGCKVPEKYPKPVPEMNIENDFGVNGTRMRLYLQTGSEIKSILSWDHFLKFKNFDIISVDTGDIKAATVTTASSVIPGQVVTSSVFLDAATMGYDGGIFICCTNISSLAANGLVLSSTSDTIDGFVAYNLNSGFSFKMDTNIVTAPVVSKFKIYGITKGQVKVLFSQELSITFHNDHHTNSSIATLGNVKAEDLVTSTTTDSFFTDLLEDIKRYEFFSRFDNTNRGTDIFSLKILHKDEDEVDNGFDSIHVKTLYDSLNAIDTSVVFSDTSIVYHPLKDPYYMYSVGDTIHVGTCEKSIVHASAQNAKVFLANRLVHKIDTNYTFPTLDTSGNPLRIIPPVGPALDNYFGVFSNISGLLEVLADLKGVNLLQKNEPDDQAMLNLSAYLNSVVGSKDVAGLNPSSFSHLVLWYTDYLLYAGLCSYIDNDFFSRYFNFHNLLLDELKALIEFVAPEFNNNNIVIRY